MTPTIVGECPGPGAACSRPLPGSRPGTAGWRIRTWCGLTEHQWESVARVNLLPVHYPRWEAKFAAQSAENLSESLLRGRRLILLGRRVAAALGVAREEYGVWCTSPMGPPCIVVPHPSGLNRIFNDPAVRDEVGRLVARILEESAQRSDVNYPRTTTEN